MRTRTLIGVLASAVALATPAFAEAQTFSPRSDDGPFVPGEALVRFEAGADAADRRAARGDAGVELEDVLALPRTQLVTTDGSVRAAIARLEDQPGVADAQPNYRYQALGHISNDTHSDLLWGVGAGFGVDVAPAWPRSRGAGQVIAIVDSGVDLTHPDLAGNLWTGPGGIHGHDFVDDDTVPDDFNLHGTHVAGTAAAIANNSLGVAGVAPEAQIMAVRVLDGDGGGNSGDVAEGIAFAANNGAGVINLSLGGPASSDPAAQNAIAIAETRGAVVVAAAGNDGTNNDTSPNVPCVLPNANLICVASVTDTGALSDFSNFGATTVDVAAPGGDGSGDPAKDILSAKPAWDSVFSENFNTTPFSLWTASHASGTVDWGPAGGGIGGGNSVTDSPSGNYAPNTDSTFEKTTAIDLSSERGCRIDYFLLRDGIQSAVDSNGDFLDAVGVGVFAGTDAVGQEFAGSTPMDSFFREEQSVSAVDGQNDVKPAFTFRSNADATVGDGATIDNFNLLCRGSTYDNVIGDETAPAGHSYTAISGTSMSAPHVAGVAALVRAVDVGVPPAQVVQALRNGAKPVAGMAGATVTGGVVDSLRSIDAALAVPNQPPPPPPPSPTAPSRPRMGGLKVSRKGVITIVVRGDAGNTGAITLTANITAARVRRIARKSFRIRSNGRATVKLKLSKPAKRQLRRKRRLRVTARAVVRNAAGLSRSSRATFRLRQVRRR